MSVPVPVLHNGLVFLYLLQMLWAATALGGEPVCEAIDVYVREGCPHCADAKSYLQGLERRRPELTVRYHDVLQDPAALEDLQALSSQYGVEQPGVPSFLVCGAFQVGFSDDVGSDEWIEKQIVQPGGDTDEQQIVTPLGAFSARDLGLPAFTIVLGLVDGFNPCAMWVLLFLLSILVNIRDRRRVALVAGTFVLVSGLVYFAFMAAWLNLFLLIGFTRWLQVLIGVLAIVIGLIHVKDFIAFGKGVSLSIPDTVKPALYTRVRSVLYAENLFAALAGVTVVAIMVNMVELLCTAGLPALYTQVLTLHDLPTMQYYFYLLLYNLAYVFDDAVMVGVAVFTMNKFKLQERQGRWLKLLSGIVVLVLGVLLIGAPGLLL